MNAVVKGSIALAVIIAVLSILIAATGLHTNPIVSGLLFIVLAIGVNIGVVYWVLKQTSSTDRYGKQLLNGLLVGVIAGALIFGISLVITNVLFPNYIDESRDATIAMMESSGMPEAQLDAQVEKLNAMTPTRQALNGTIGTVVTSVLIAAIVGIFVRKK